MTPRLNLWLFAAAGSIVTVLCVVAAIAADRYFEERACEANGGELVEMHGYEWCVTKQHKEKQ